MQRTTETFKLLLGKRKGNNKGNSLSTCLGPTICRKLVSFLGFLDSGMSLLMQLFGKGLLWGGSAEEWECHSCLKGLQLTARWLPRGLGSPYWFRGSWPPLHSQSSNDLFLGDGLPQACEQVVPIFGTSITQIPMLTSDLSPCPVSLPMILFFMLTQRLETVSELSSHSINIPGDPRLWGTIVAFLWILSKWFTSHFSAKPQQCCLISGVRGFSWGSHSLYPCLYVLPFASLCFSGCLVV